MLQSDSKKYHIITFGCQMNERDSETLAGYLEERGYTPAGSHEEADLVLINTCSVRDNADKRFFGTLGQIKKHKEHDPDFVIGVCGCMMQQQYIVDEIKEKYPWVDIVFGTHNIHVFPEMLDEVLISREKQLEKARREAARKQEPGEEDGTPFRYRQKTMIDVWKEGGDVVEGMPYKRLYDYKAFVNIMFGCNNFCTYCIVPYTRGRERSREAANIKAEVERLAAGGVKEVTLLGQNVNSYRGKDVDFTDLIYMLAQIDGLERIRFMTSHPKDISDKLINAFGDCGKLCKFIHLPVQSGSDEVIRRMNRHYTRDQYLRIIDKLRTAAPDICISTDIIVGFPGETEAQFADTLDLVERVGYDSAFTFLYSIRPGTPAAKYPDQIPEEVKHERFDRLVEAVNRHSLARNKAYVGRTVEVMAEGASKRDAGRLGGRTDGFKLVNFDAGPAAGGLIRPGDLCKVKITEAKTFSLVGELVTDRG
ncbi:MAG: tRNA (N6-isopentenyl adenosine(37)-C2)-methylthiotransferase MiaB [Clostridiales bacterium]|nr:tRNA (N6-isopentenyl adenosine(37)-C2)-methylthiotransferase MiaB [Clostridiales bacterium]